METKVTSLFSFFRGYHNQGRCVGNAMEIFALFLGSAIDILRIDEESLCHKVKGFYLATSSMAVEAGFNQIG